MIRNFMISLWTYRGFILGSVRREFQSQYRNSILGATWTILNPLAMIIVYTVIFSQVMRAKLPGVDDGFAYSIYLCSGVLTWGFFSEIMSRAQNMFFEHANMIKKINFPRICLPIIVVISALLNFTIIFTIFVFFLWISGRFPGLAFLGVFPVLLVQIMFSIGLGIIVGVLNVFFRDVGQFTGIALQFWFWLTPIVYPATILSDRLRDYLLFNPMASLIGAYQGIFVRNQWPQWGDVLPVTLLSMVLCVLALLLFRKRSGEMVDEL